ncbi:conjugal transfer mating-pair stabilization protein TraG [Enterobacter hormaechei]|jgi:conjugal transfer mating pair stabilization protein TraG|uniref:Conjugal transfer mating pair stabilization protein TraG n=2 Tax=Enterobacteriaceae TaxID=543 RepID=A0A8T6BC32_ECOLX|nr:MULTISPECIES: conjugal transfer mating-pair stabilization protein TraG [Enterobacterales]ELK1250169.1 conjugal transfer mating pair stabilization protein TraG [Citrobacter freundii]HCM9622186.1 conjugal transfer mating pair stabilization protein TraG [Enterobacter cloacae subsp. cloacae]EHF4958710.1 conjugal transfer mating pair stabilization protein TraG [Enterobacter hormaechei]EHR1016355.1 conjugal transfer mating pair stabilization protein TraG [Escherichia coli]EIH1767088.1 conjugal tr
MQEIYVIAGGDWLTQTLNAIVTFMSTENWVVIRRIATAFSVLVVAISWIRRHNIMDMLGWAGVIVLMSLLVSVRTSVQIIDISNQTKVYKVDNVPVGLALPASLTTKIGYALVQGYEMVFSQPDSITYSKTGMIFGANLVSRSTDFLSQNPEITTIFTDYVQNCVMGDIFLNGKYTMEDLMNSADPYTLIFSKPSPLRGVFNNNNQFLTCEEAAAVIKPKLALDTQTGGKTWSYYVRQLFGGRPNPDILFSQMIGDSYNYFYGAGQSAASIVRQNVTMNALRNGIMSYAARNGDTSSLLNIATTSSMEKQRLAHATVGQVALRSLPMSQTLIVGLTIGIFPLMVLGGMFNAVTLNVLKGYVLAIMWVQSWPLLYAILNSCMTFYAKANGSPVVLSELSQVQIKYSDLATTAGYLSMLIPPLAWGMLKGLGAGFSNLYSHLASSAISPAATAASGAVDGNYSYANMQTENVSGNSWNTNSSTMFGQMSQQLGNGATSTQMRDGSTVTDSTQAASKLPVSINFARQLASAQQEMAREAQTQSQSAMQSFSSSMSSTWQTLSQFGTNRGSSDSMTQGADSTMSAQDSMMASKMRTAVESYAKAHNISNDQATQELASRSSRASAGLYGDASAHGGIGIKAFGTGGGVSFRAGAKAGVDFDDLDSHQASSSTRASQDARHDIDAKSTKDFKEASDYFTSRKINESGSHTDNNAASRADQLSASLSSAKQSLEQYSTSQARSKEYAEMASRTETMSGQVNEDLNQQFAQYVRKQAPHDADSLLTDTGSPEVAAKRRELAWSFVQSQVQPSVDNAYSDAKDGLGQSMDNVSAGGGRQEVLSDHAAHKASIESATSDAGIKGNVKGSVDGMMTETRNNISGTQSEIKGASASVDNQYSALERHHQSEANNQGAKYNHEKASQNAIPGADSPEELLEKAKKLENNHKK